MLYSRFEFSFAIWIATQLLQCNCDKQKTKVGPDTNTNPNTHKQHQENIPPDPGARRQPVKEVTPDMLQKTGHIAALHETLLKINFYCR